MENFDLERANRFQSGEAFHIDGKSDGWFI